MGFLLIVDAPRPYCCTRSYLILYLRLKPRRGPCSKMQRNEKQLQATAATPRQHPRATGAVATVSTAPLSPLYRCTMLPAPARIRHQLLAAARNRTSDTTVMHVEELTLSAPSELKTQKIKIPESHSTYSERQPHHDAYAGACRPELAPALSHPSEKKEKPLVTRLKIKYSRNHLLN